MDTNMEQKLSQANDLREQEKYGESSRLYTECLTDLVASNDFTGLIHCLGGQSLIYKNLSTKNDSPYYKHLVLAFAKEAYEVGEKHRQELDGRTLSIAYSTYADALLANGYTQDALPFFEKSLAVSSASIPEKGRLKAHIGGLQCLLGNTSLGLATMLEALADIRTGNLEDYTIRVWETGTLNGLSMVYSRLGEKDKALATAREALTIEDEHKLTIRKRQTEDILNKIIAGRTDFSLT